MSDKHYMGNPLLKRANVANEFSQEQLFELAKCAVDPVYFAKNYIKIVNVDDGLVPFDMWPFQEKMLRTFHENRFTICKLPRQPLENNTPIPTPNGYTKIKDLKIGDVVYDLSGNKTKVINKVSYKNTEKCYKLSFKGQHFEEDIVCDKDHFWRVYINEKPIVLTAEQISCIKEKITLQRTKFNTLVNNWNKIIELKSIKEVKPTSVSCIEVENKDHSFLCGKNFIPTINSGKSTTSVSFLLHYAIFNEKVSIAILANKASSAKDILSRLQVSFENLPNWMQPGVKSWNKTSLELDNGSKIITASTSASSVRGGSYNIIFLDEFAFVPNNIAVNFMNSVYPTISSGKETKVIICSTPQGLNYFYKMWDEAIKKLNDYVPLEINWNDVPGRDEKWKIKTIANLGGGEVGARAFDQEFSCSFLGSSNTLVSASKLSSMTHKSPIRSKKGLDIYEDPIEGHQYMINVDVARGVDLDYSVFTVIDITKMSYKLVAKYRDNQIKPIMFPYIIKDAGLHYNKAFVLCETNDVGDQIATGLHYDLEYPNLLTCFIKGRKGQVLGQGFGGDRVDYGVKMSANVKKIGSLNLKMLLESDKLIIEDYDTISELFTFVQKSNTFKAEEGKNDDLVDCLVTFSWASTQEYFREITDDDIRKRLFKENEEREEDDSILPIGFIETGIEPETFVEKDLLWNVVSPDELVSLWDYSY
jgi:hypothetical protein